MIRGTAADPLRRTLDEVFAGPAYRWVERTDPPATLRYWWGVLREWVDALGVSHPRLRDLLVVVLVVMLAAIVLHTVRIVARTIRTGETRRTDGAPLPVARDQGWYRREAERLAAEGRFVEAIQADFVALVLGLDARRALRFHPSKTPAEYAAELRAETDGRRAFRDLVAGLYGYAFARRPCDAAAWADWRRRAVPEAYAAAE